MDTSTENPYTLHSKGMSTASEYESDPEPVLIGSQAVPRDVKKTLPRAPTDGPAPPAKGNQSKTAHLIEMYRERERQTQTSPIPSSRLPVRQASLQAAANGKERDRSTSPSPRPSPNPRASAELPEIEDTADDKVSVEDIPIDLPTQYVHGAPLHNVIEEPEEEEA